MLWWISIAALASFSSGIIVYALLGNKFYLSHLILFFILCLVSSSITLYIKPSLSYISLLVTSITEIVFIVIVLAGLRFLPGKSPVLVGLTSFTFIILSVTVSLGYLADRNYYLQVDTNLQNFPTYVHKDLQLWPKYLAHFPKDISSKWQETSFFRGRLYDLTVLELRCTMQSREIEQILAMYLGVARYVQDGYDPASVKNKEKAYWVQKFRDQSNQSFAPLPRHFKIIVLYVDPEALTSAWQLRYNCGIAVSTRNNEVIYWATYP